MYITEQLSTRVALVRGEVRIANVQQALAMVLGELPWSSYTHVVVKPNLVVYNQPNAVTHRDSLATVLALIRDHYLGRLTIAEGCAIQPTTEAFAAHDYPELAQRYGCTLLDLNADETVPCTVYDQAARPLPLRLARTIVESDCRVSLSLPKTHDTVLVTLSIKNMIMASLVNRRLTPRRNWPFWLDCLGQAVFGHGRGWGSDKVAMHQSYPIMNLNLARLAQLVLPHLSILDGYVAMEGAGPVHGDPVPWRIALAGTDPLAVDVVAAHLMGYALGEIGYLAHCARLGLGQADLAKIAVVGNVTPEIVAQSFRPHPQYLAQSQWAHPRMAELLATTVTPA